ncbi:MAG: hypothetical protein IPM82_05535, partial [Saprospiraceae bacterium]|nr:hypothetical protein [Saprospiraceae bacterium]
MTAIAENRPLVIPPDVLQSIGLSEQSIKLELAIIFYKNSSYLPAKPPVLRACRVAFLHELGLRKSPSTTTKQMPSATLKPSTDSTKNSPQAPMIVVSDTTAIST